MQSQSLLDLIVEFTNIVGNHVSLLICHFYLLDNLCRILLRIHNFEVLLFCSYDVIIKELLDVILIYTILRNEIVYTKTTG